MRTALFVSMLAALALGQPVDVLAQPGGGGGAQPSGRPKIVFDEESTPLQKAVEASVQKRRDAERDNPHDRRCQEALADPNSTPKQIAKACKTPGHKTKKLDRGSACPDCGDQLNAAGKLIGKKVATETVLEYPDPAGKGLASWKRVGMAKRAVGNVGHGTGNASREDNRGGEAGARLRNAAAFPNSSNNDDKDCIETATGARKGGYAGPAGTDLIPDGAADSCYDAAGNLKANHEELIDEDGTEQVDDDNDDLFDEDPVNGINDDRDCLSGPDRGDPADPDDDRPGEHLRDADCLNGGQLKPGFIELLDEDGAEPIDQDADGRFDEDPPANFADACSDFGKGGEFIVSYRSRKKPDSPRKEFRMPHRPDLVDSNGDECDVTRAMMVVVNAAVMSEQTGDNKKKAFKVDADGRPDTSAEATGVDYGTEEREVKLTEEYAVRCEDPDAELIDGECVAPATAGAAFDAMSLPRGAALFSAADVGATASTVKKRAMMGFTFAPPVLEWGFRVEEEACIDLLFDEFCFEIFFARVGYEFDFGVGLRLPVEVSVSDVPAPSALAEDEVTLKAALEPLDFSVRDFKEFCREHELDSEWFISSCDRFAFPEFISSLDPFTSGDDKDGAEFVAHATIFAGVIVRVLSIPVITWGIDSSFDLPALCTMMQILDEKINLLEFGLDAVKTGDLVGSLKNQLGNCGSFTTPFGFEADPFNPGARRLRSFPFAKSFDIRADCVDALREGEVVTIKGKKRPICTNLLLGTNGASLGVGLGIELAAGSNRITADMSVSGDAQAAAQGIAFVHDATEEEARTVSLGPVTLDNFDPNTHEGSVRLDDFTYLLNTIQLRLKANLEFGGILSFIPDIDSFTIWSFHFTAPGDFGIPIGQHAGTEPIEIPIFVENHALAVDAHPGTLLIQPGTFGTFQVQVQNLGNVAADFDNFARGLSNRRDQSMPFTFVINSNTDFDCRDAAGQRLRGYPYDNVADDCFTASGEVRGDRTEALDEDSFGPDGAPVAVRDQDGDGLADEDPPDAWDTLPGVADFAQRELTGVQPGELSPTALTLSVRPFRHPLTAPGLYPVQITGDSRTARLRGLEAVDPSGLTRLGASDVVFIRVATFFDPNVAMLPPSTSGKPGVLQTYGVEGENGGNSDDSIDVVSQFADFNQAGCTLTTMGTKVDCPYRAAVTQIPAGWTTIAELGPRYGPLNPLGRTQDNFTILPPSAWAGMQDTTYQFTITGTSTEDPALPRASESKNGELTVVATKESMTRYIGLELVELIQQIQTANTQGTKTGGLLPLATQAQKNNDQALASILADNLAGGSKSHGQVITMMEAFVHALDGFSHDGTGFPEAPDFRVRADAILLDLARAQSSVVTSAR